MSAVEVEIAEEIPGGRRAEDRPEPDRAGEGEDWRRRQRDPIEFQIEREITYRQLIQSISTIVVVVLYMVFTLLRDRDSGVVVIDPEDNDWDEG